jgi:L-lactate dehydrogenase complex protein LldE
VLERLGHRVEFRHEQTCCGQMHFNTGYRGDAAKLMRRFVDVFADAEIVCAPSTSCVGMIRDHYPTMAEESGDAGLVAAVAALVPRVLEFTELLVDRFGVTDVGATFPHSVTYHPSCHALRALNLREQPLKLLKAVRGLELRPLPRNEECCGFGGTFSLKNAGVSSAMLADKMAAVLETGAEVCTAVDNSCLLHIGGGLSRASAAVRCLHIAEILAATDDEGTTEDTENTETSKGIGGERRLRGARRMAAPPGTNGAPRERSRTELAGFVPAATPLVQVWPEASRLEANAHQRRSCRSVGSVSSVVGGTSS